MTRQLPERLAAGELAGLWQRCWKAMARAGPDGWRGVTIRLSLDGPKQRRAVAGLLGRPVKSGTASVGITLGDLDDLLTRADADWGLVTVVESVAGRLPDRAGDAEARATAIAEVRAAAHDVASGAPDVERWLDDLDGGMLARLYGRGELDLVVTAADLLGRLPVDGTPLAALASSATGDPKALAGTTLEGLVLRGLALRFGEDRPRTAGERRALWEAAGVVTDDVASQVLVLALPVAPHRALGRWLWEAAVDGWPFRVTLHQLVRSQLAVAEPRPVYVCENPAVLRAAAEKLGGGTAPVVCTEGRPSVACMRLLAMLHVAGCELRYHGDFDWPGLRIAATVLEQAKAVPWRLTAEDYLEGLGRLGAGRPALRGAHADSPWDPGLARAMAEAGTVVYEEDVLDALLGDLGAAGHPRAR